MLPPTADDSAVEVLNILAWDAKLDALSYYEILGITERDNVLECEQAYHRFALRFHPDCHPESDASLKSALTRIFQRGVEARRVLCDAELRRRYEQQLIAGKYRLFDEATEVRIDLDQSLVSLHERCRSAGAKLEAMAAERAWKRGARSVARRCLLQALMFDGNTNQDLERCIAAIDALPGG